MARIIRLKLLAAFALTAILTATGGCQRIAPVRTLPSYYRGVYVPMVQNESFEPGLEEIMTREIQEEFLADGRLDVVAKRDADLTMKATILSVDKWTSDSRGDDVASATATRIRMGVQLIDPYDETMLIADLGVITIIQNSTTDVRSINFEAEPDNNERLAERVATAVVMRTLTGFPINTADLPAGLTLPEQAHPDVLETDVLDRASLRD